MFTVDYLKAMITTYQVAYAAGTPAVSDAVYDDLVRTFRKLGGIPPIGSPSGTIKHEYKMLSLDNVFTLPELERWCKNILKVVPDATFAVEPKLDGVALSIEYRDGKLFQAVTRGDGDVGEDVTANALTIRNLPHTIPVNGKVVVRGEVVITKLDFIILNTERELRGEVALKNSRNGAAGALNLKDSSECAKRRLSFFAHGVEELPSKLAEYPPRLWLVRQYDIPVIPNARWGAHVHSIFECIDTLLKNLPEYAIDTDGIVVKVESTSHREKLGETTTFPRWAIAYKWARYEATTTLRKITYQLGRTGAVTPVAEFDPVDIEGTTITRASVCNAEEMDRLDLHWNDSIVVEKSGKIIPKVVRVNKELRSTHAMRYVFPSYCPRCGHPLSTYEGVIRKCTNHSCMGVLEKVLEHFVSKSCMDIDGLGPAVTNQLVALNWVKGLPDLYKLTVSQLKSLDKVGEPKAKSIVASIEASKKQPLWRLIAGLNIPYIGSTLAKALVKRYNTADNIYSATANPQTIVDEVEGFGTVAAVALCKWFRLNTLDEFRELGLNMGTEPTEIDTRFKDWTFVITGTLEDYSRDSIKEAIEQAGGKVLSTVSKNTNFLIAGRQAGSKLKKARELGVGIVTEAEFTKMLTRK